MLTISEETPDDGWEVEALYDLAFAPGRFALSSYQLREGVAPVAPLCLAARDEYAVLVGAIRYWPIRVGGRPALLLGPVAVHPIRQGEGVGAALMADSLDRARVFRWRHVVLVGDAPYYRRFGFEPVADRVAFPPPVNPERVLAQTLDPSAPVPSGAVTRWEGPTPDRAPIT